MKEIFQNTNSKNPLKLLDSVYLFEQSFAGVTVRGVLVVGTQRALMFDTLIFPDQTGTLSELWSGRDLIVVYSHADWDHVWGTSGVSPAIVIAQEECARRFGDPGDVQRTLDDYRSGHEGALSQVKLIPPQETFRSDLSLDLGGLSVELRHCPGHTSDSILALVPERNLLLGADCIERPLPLLNEGAEDLQRWIETLTGLAADHRIKTCIPSHGPVAGLDILTDNISYLKSLGCEETDTPQGLDSFYRKGHQDNRAKVAKLQDGAR
jgi:glyoxylase-like metal-dependent hydrolase (beta-lactamase superfamily II)